MKAKPVPGTPTGGPVPRFTTVPSAKHLQIASLSNDAWVCYKGSKAAIVAAGILADGWFPGDPGRNKTLISFRKLRGLYGNVRGHREPGAVDQVRRCGRDLFEVMRETTDAELTEHAAAQEREEAANEAREDLRHARAMESAAIDAMTSSPEEFRKRVEHFLLTARYAARCSDGGYRCDLETWEAFDEAMTRVEEVVAQGAVEFSPTLQAKKIAEIKAETAKADAGLQSFLKAILETPHDAFAADDGHFGRRP